MKKIIISIMILLFCSLIISCETIEKAVSFISSEPEPEQITMIKAKWKEYKPKLVTKIYIEKPNIGNPYQAGKLSTEFLANGLNTTKFVRYLAGLSENVVMTDEFNDLAQHGAVILAKLGYLTHTPTKPGDMDQNFYKRAYESTKTANIFQTIGTAGNLTDAVKGFCDDSDESNIDRVGHRCWVLNPRLEKTGFGYATTGNAENIKSFTPMQVFDQSNTKGTEIDYILWPNKGYFPNNFFSPQQAWSVHLNANNFDLAKCKPIVKLTNVSNSKVWIFKSSDKNKTGKYFNINKVHNVNFGGFSYIIIFKPDNITSFLFDKKYSVEINGLVDNKGKEYKLEYEVEFFTIF